VGYFYFDESIQERRGFIIGAFVYSVDDLDPPVAAVLTRHGLIPGHDEYHSCANAAGNPKHAALRGAMRGLLHERRFGVVVHPAERRDELGIEAVRGLRKLLDANSLTGQHVAVFDEGIFSSTPDAQQLMDDFGLRGRVDPVFQADSRVRGGLQVADLVAHCCGRMLFEHISDVKKMVKAGENSGYDPDLDLELEFELWAGLRYNWFAGEDKNRPEGEEFWPVVDVSDYGLHISDACTPELRDAAYGRFAKSYLGCIH